jgi:hypothetical protein
MFICMIATLATYWNSFKNNMHPHDEAAIFYESKLLKKEHDIVKVRNKPITFELTMGYWGSWTVHFAALLSPSYLVPTSALQESSRNWLPGMILSSFQLVADKVGNYSPSEECKNAHKTMIKSLWNSVGLDLVPWSQQDSLWWTWITN